MHTAREEDGGRNWESSTEKNIYICITIFKIASGTLLYNTGSSTVFCDNLEGWGWVGDRREVQEGRDICILISDSCCCTTETNTTLQRNYPPTEKKNWQRETKE